MFPGSKLLCVNLLASEQDTLKGNTIEIQGYLFVYMCVDYVCHFVSDHRVFLC